MAADGVQVQMCVTSPPYWGLRDYKMGGQIGLEKSLTDWVGTMQTVFGLVYEVLRDDGTLWLNLGDSYGTSGGDRLKGFNSRYFGTPDKGGKQAEFGAHHPKMRSRGTRKKNLLGQPWRAAFALQDWGWNLRSDIIWHKPNPMPETVRDRPTKAHEHIFLMSKSGKYYYDADAIAEPVSADTHARVARGRDGGGQNPKALAAGMGKTPAGWDTSPDGDHRGLEGRYAGKAADKPDLGKGKHRVRIKANTEYTAAISAIQEGKLTRNIRDVWPIGTEGYKGAHFATFPRELVRRCILAGSKPGDIILDPFHGSGTTGEVAVSLGRHFVGLELNPEYVKLCQARKTTIGLAL